MVVVGGCYGVALLGGCYGVAMVVAMVLLWCLLWCCSTVAIVLLGVAMVLL